MIKVLFICHGSTAGSRELAALVGQNGANNGIGESRRLRFYYDWGNEKRAFISSPFSVTRHTVALLCDHFFYFCWQACP